jgi:hypothetical protein
MLILKNSFIFIASVLVMSLIIIIFDKLGMNKYVNLFVSAFFYGIFVTAYFQKIFLSLSFFFGFYTILFMISYSLEVIAMLVISCSVLFVIKMVMPTLKSKEVNGFLILNNLYKKG